MYHPEGRGEPLEDFKQGRDHVISTIWRCLLDEELGVGVMGGRCEQDGRLSQSRSEVRVIWGRGAGNRNREKERFHLHFGSRTEMDRMRMDVGEGGGEKILMILMWWAQATWWREIPLTEETERKGLWRKVKSSPERWGLWEVWVVMLTWRQMTAADNMGLSSEFQLELSIWEAFGTWVTSKVTERDENA